MKRDHNEDAAYLLQDCIMSEPDDGNRERMLAEAADEYACDQKQVAEKFKLIFGIDYLHYDANNP